MMLFTVLGCIENFPFLLLFSKESRDSVDNMKRRIPPRVNFPKKILIETIANLETKILCNLSFDLKLLTVLITYVAALNLSFSC